MIINGLYQRTICQSINQSINQSICNKTQSQQCMEIHKKKILGARAWVYEVADLKKTLAK